jgi:hypothetical protein
MNDKTTALARQVGGEHYKNLPIQPIEFAEINQLSALQTKVVKYISRHKNKHGERDIRAAIHCAELMIEMHSGKWISRLPMLTDAQKMRQILIWNQSRGDYYGKAVTGPLNAHAYARANLMSVSEEHVLFCICDSPTLSNVELSIDLMKRIIEKDYPPQAEQ